MKSKLMADLTAKSKKKAPKPKSKKKAMGKKGKAC